MQYTTRPNDSSSFSFSKTKPSCSALASVSNKKDLPERGGVSTDGEANRFFSSSKLSIC